MIVSRSLDPTTGTMGEAAEITGPVAFTGGLGFCAFSAAPNTLVYAPGSGALAPISLIQWFDRSGRPLEQLGVGTDLAGYNAFYQRISPDGRRVAVSAFPSATADLWLVDTTRGVSSRFTFDEA